MLYIQLGLNSGSNREKVLTVPSKNEASASFSGKCWLEYRTGGGATIWDFIKTLVATICH